MQHSAYVWGLKKHDRTIISTIVYWLSKLVFKIAPNWFARFMRMRGFSVKPYHLNLKQLELKKQAKSFYLELEDNKIRVFEWGDGPVVLLVHGWGGRALQMDAFVNSLLEKGFKVVAFDHKGHGESSSNFSSYPEIFRSSELLVSHYENDLYGVIAHSIGSNSIFKVSEKIERKLQLAIVAPMDNFLGYLEKMRARIGIYEKLFASVINQIETDCRVSLDELCELNFAKIGRHDVLLVHDKFDRINKIRASHDIQRNLQGSSLMETEMLGHSRILKNSEVVARVVAHFTVPTV